MKKLCWIFCALAVCVSGCKNNQVAQQALPDEKLSAIMADLYIAEAGTTGLTGYPKDSLMKVYQTQVFELHGTSAEAYESDLRLISNDLIHLKQIVLEAQKKLESGNGVN